MVVGMPEQPRGALPAYAGPLAAVRTRPAETYSFPIPLGASGPVRTLADIPLTYPLVCMTEESGLGQPLVDNHAGEGVPVWSDAERRSGLMGFSRDCSLATSVSYWFGTADGLFHRLGDIGAAGPPVRVRLPDGRQS
mgnify:FL=1